jgi:hypothetical protein
MIFMSDYQFFTTKRTRNPCLILGERKIGTRFLLRFNSTKKEHPLPAANSLGSGAGFFDDPCHGPPIAVPIYP